MGYLPDGEVTRLATAAVYAVEANLADPQWGSFGTASTAAQNSAAIDAALASGARVLQVGEGTFDFDSHHLFTNIALRGAGGTPTNPATKFRATAAAAQFEFAGACGDVGGFHVDGNYTATTPLKRSGGTGANGCSFRDVTVASNAMTGPSGTATAAASTDEFTTGAAHGLTVGQPIIFTASGAGGVIVGFQYFVKTVPTTTTFTVSLIPSSGVVNVTSNGSITYKTRGSTNDLTQIHGAQNDLWQQVAFLNADRDLTHFDQGTGGNLFSRCEWAGAGRYHHRFDTAVAGGPYTEPADNEFHQCILEGAAGTSVVWHNHGYNNRYSATELFTTNQPTGPIVDIVNGLKIEINTAQIQCTAVDTTGSQGIVVRNNSQLTLSGAIDYLHLDQCRVIDGPLSFVYDRSTTYAQSTAPAPTVNAAQNSGTTAQCLALEGASHVWNLQTPTDPILLSQNFSRTANRWFMDGNGTMRWFPGTGFVPDVHLLRRAIGVLGTFAPGQQVLATGSGTTAQRPTAAAATAGAIYHNSDLHRLQASDGTGWSDPAVGAPATGPASNDWLALNGQGLAAANQLTVNQREICVPFYVPVPYTIKTLGVTVAVVGNAGSLLRLGIRADTGAGYPGAVLVDAGTVAGDALATPTIGITPLALAPGWYWASITAQNAATTAPTIAASSPARELPFHFRVAAAATLNGLSCAGYFQGGVSGALGAFAAGASVSGTAGRLYGQIN